MQLCYNPNFSQELLSDWVQAKGSFSGGRPLAQTLQTLEKYYCERIKTTLNKHTSIFSFLEAHGGAWFAGDNLTFADFVAWEMLDQHRLLIPGCLDKFARLLR